MFLSRLARNKFWGKSVGQISHLSNSSLEFEIHSYFKAPDSFGYCIRVTDTPTRTNLLLTGLTVPSKQTCVRRLPSSTSMGFLGRSGHAGQPPLILINFSLRACQFILAIATLGIYANEIRVQEKLFNNGYHLSRTVGCSQLRTQHLTPQTLD